jgi:hypothetical protein
MKSRERHVKAPIARQQRLRAQEALAELERAQKILLQSDKEDII